MDDGCISRCCGSKNRVIREAAVQETGRWRTYLYYVVLKCHSSRTSPSDAFLALSPPPSSYLLMLLRQHRLCARVLRAGHWVHWSSFNPALIGQRLRGARDVLAIADKLSLVSRV